MIEGLNSALRKSLSELDPVTLHFLESCVSCGLCTPHCPYVNAGVEYEPVNKAEELRKIVRKRITAAGYVLGSIVGAGYPKSEEDLKRMSYMAYRCVNCRNCYSTCPFGIYSGELIRILRGFLTTLRRAPSILRRLAELEGKDLSSVGSLNELWNGFLKEAGKSLGRSLPMDKEGTEFLYLPSITEILLTPDAVISTIRILDMMGEDWTIPSKPLGFEFSVGTFIGDRDAEKLTLAKVDSYVKGIKAKRVILTHGGTPYEELRFLMPSILGEKQVFSVIHITEYLYDLYLKGKVKIEGHDGFKVTWHDPCKLRSAGVKKQPRELVKISASNYVELPKSQGVFSGCCGGGSGISLLTDDLRKRIAELLGNDVGAEEWEDSFVMDLMTDYDKVLKVKSEEIKKSGAEIVVTACPTCIYSINRGKELSGGTFRAVHIVHYLFDKLIIS